MSKQLQDKLSSYEKKFGGVVEGLSSYTKYDISVSGDNKRMGNWCQGGDRFTNESTYKEVYAKNIQKFLDDPIILFEVGILKGSGLAVWNEIFKNNNAKILGGDVDISNCLGNFEKIKRKGGFSNINKINTNISDVFKSRVSCFKFDQYDKNNENYLKTILKGKKIDVFIDDGDHQDVPNIQCAKSVSPFLNKNSIYFVEDVKPSRVDKIVKEFYDLGLNLCDCTKYQDGRVGGVLVFQFDKAVSP